uniref:V-type proton ATPase subunit a n=1 Tax=Lygus hesperus TaxID=30085 RepID=A0A0A9Z0B4_LYGHE
MRCEFHTTLVFMAGWCPMNQLENLNRCINEVAPEAGTKPALDYNAIPPMNAIPPTYIPTTKVISAFQNIVNTYGSPRYQEVNPGLFTIVTFPFLFGVMYGDIGHG